MSLRLIMGTSGQGKTARVIDEVIRRAQENPSRNYYVIVPEQFSLEMQKTMVEHHPRHGYFNIDVMSFFRMAYRVFDECRFKPKDILEDLGVSLVLRKILSEHEAEFPYFKKSIKKAGFLDELKSMLMEFLSYEIGWKQVQETTAKLGEYPHLEKKCRELGRIYEYFEKEISSQFMVTEQILDVLITLLPQSELLKKAVFYFDGFTGFTPVQLHFLRELLSYAGQINVTITIPVSGGNPFAKKDRDLFTFSEKMVRSLLQICRESGQVMEYPVILERKVPIRFSNSTELSFLEKNLFRQGAEEYPEKPEHIHVTVCRNPEMEADYILHKIEQMVRQKGYRYRDFAVVTGSVGEYTAAFERQASILRIPLFEDSKKKVSYHPGVETLRAVFHLVEMNYSYESVFRYLKSGMTGLCDEDTDYLENYVLAAGIRGYGMWKRPFSRRLSAAPEEQKEKLETLRMKLMEETEAFYLVWKDAKQTVREKMAALYEFMGRLEYHRKLKEMAGLACREGDFVREKEYEQLFSLLAALLDKIVGIFGEECLPAKELAEIMDAGLDALGLGVVPLSMDQIILGDLKRTRLPDIRVLFVAGVNEGSLPPSLEERGLLNDDEKEILKACGITLSGGLPEQSVEDEFYMYLAFTKPREELWFTCSLSGRDGKGLMPSSVLKYIGRVFPKLNILRCPGEEKRYYFNEEDSREYLIEGLKELEKNPESMSGQKAWAMLFGYWQKKDNLKKDLEKYWGQRRRGGQVMPLPKELTRELLGEELRGSVTKLERFAACPYQYYCTYGLGLSEREEYVIRPVDLGNLFHQALERFAGYLKESGYTWKNVPEETVNALIEKSLSESVDERVGDVLDSTARNHYKRRTVGRILKRTVEILRMHLKNSRLEPDQFELHFGRMDHLHAADIPLKEGGRMYLEGFVDRVDICEEEDEILLRVIDYKSGMKQFYISDFYHGLQLQLVIYMSAAREIYEKEKGKKVTPAGMYYYHLKDPIFKLEQKDEEKKVRDFRMSGYTNSHPDILEKIEENQSSLISAPVRRTKTGEAYKNSPVMETADFLAMSDFARQKAQEIGEQIYSGQIAPLPYKNDRGTACDYCPYGAVCGFDAKHPGYRYRELERQSAKEVLEEIRRQVD